MTRGVERQQELIPSNDAPIPESFPGIECLFINDSLSMKRINCTVKYRQKNGLTRAKIGFHHKK